MAGESGVPVADAPLAALLAKLETSDKVALAAGVDTWHTAAAPVIGLPSLKVSDGPNGVRGETFGAVASACFPCGSALGATWDPELIHRVGAALAHEAKWKGVHVLLAPTINIQRHPLAGRHFECYSEDPFLTARLAVAYVTGVQSGGVAATAKHFVCNDSEFERHTISSEVSERALREIYLVPFEAVIREAGVWALMAAYNRVNGTYAAEHELLMSLVKGEWGFDGLVMSDWWGTQSTVDSANNGLDLEMPGPPMYYGTMLADAVATAQVREGVLEDKSLRLLRLATRVGALDAPPSGDERAVDDPAHRVLLRRVAAEAAVLLRNDGLLPLAPGSPGLPLDPGSPGTLGVIGPLADHLTVQGGGSAHVEAHRSASLLEAIRAVRGDDVQYEPGGRAFTEPVPLREGLSTVVDGAEEPGATVTFFGSPDCSGEPQRVQLRRRLHMIWLGDPAPGEVEGRFSLRATARYRAGDTGDHRFTLASAGRSRLFLDGHCIIDNWTSPERGPSFYGAGSTEVEGVTALESGRAYDLVLEYSSPDAPGIRGVTVGCLPPPSDALVERAVELAGRVDTVVLVVGNTAETEKEGTDRATLQLAGAQDVLVERILDANPRTVVVVNAGSPVAMPWADRVPALLWGWFPGQEGDLALADVLFGRADPGGRLPMTMPMRVEDCPAHRGYPGANDRVEYVEDVFVGYRGYARNNVAPLFAFGHGLSYTSFELAPMTIDREQCGAGGVVRVAVPVTNTGPRPGSQVVQLYVRDVDSTFPRPALELKGFAKVHLAPGARALVEFELTERSFAAWDPDRHRWCVEAGEFELMVGTSSAAITERRTIKHLG